MRQKNYIRHVVDPLETAQTALRGDGALFAFATSFRLAQTPPAARGVNAFHAGNRWEASIADTSTTLAH